MEPSSFAPIRAFSLRVRFFHERSNKGAYRQWRGNIYMAAFSSDAICFRFIYRCFALWGKQNNITFVAPQRAPCIWVGYSIVLARERWLPRLDVLKSSNLFVRSEPRVDERVGGKFGYQERCDGDDFTAVSLSVYESICFPLCRTRLLKLVLGE